MNSLRQGGAFCQYPDEEKERKIHEAALLKSIGTTEKSRDYSKLHREVRVDKNGVPRTHWVRNEEVPKEEEAVEMGKTAKLRKKLKQNLAPFFYKPIQNKHSEVSAYVSGNSINKIGSRKAIEKSEANGFTVDQHFEIANRIIPLFRNSYLKETKGDRDNDPNIKSVKRFAISAKLSNGVKTKVWITVKETRVEGHRIYSIELMEIKKAPPTQEGASSGTAGKASVTTESRNPSKNGKSEFKPVTSSATLPRTSGDVNKNPKKSVKKSAKSKKWLWVDGNGKIWTRKSVLEAWRQGMAGGL